MSYLERIAQELNGQRSGKGLMVCCPAHDDHNPSLSVSEGDGGRLLVRCFAGCTQGNVIAALNARGLWPASSTMPAPAPIATRARPTKQELGPPPPGTPPPDGIGASMWVYRSREGEVLSVTERIDTPQGKQFRPHSWDRAAGKWVQRAWPAPRPLYGLEQLSKFPNATVLIVEGEKAACAARKLVDDRFAVLTWPNGAKSVASADWSALTGRKVLLWPDADEPGVRAADAICDILRPICPEVRAIEIDLKAPDAFTRNAGFDAADALALDWNYESFRQWAEPKIKTVWKQAQFDPVPDSLIEARLARKNAEENKCLTGIRFADKALGGGLGTSDVLALTGPSGGGKTEAALLMATFNAAMGRRVHFFALEAERYELSHRLTYRELADLYFEPKTFSARAPSIGRPLSFCDWMAGVYGDKLRDLEEKAEAVVREKYRTLNIYYRDREFGAEELRKQVLAVKDRTDLIILDHFHYVDLPEGDNENRAMTDLVKTIRDVALISRKPFIVVAHIRKRDSRNKALVPDLEDIHGTSNLAKIATKALMLAPCFEQTRKPGEFYTYMRVAKNRRDGSRTRFTAVCTFDTHRNAYRDEFILGRLSQDGQKFEPLKDDEMPYWVKD